MTQSDNTAAAQHPSKKKKQSTNAFIKSAVIASLIISLLAIAFSYAIWLRGQQQHKTTQVLLQHQLTYNNAQASAQISDLTHKVTALSRRLQRATDHSASHRALDQAKYYVRLANLNLTVAQNSQAAIHLLTQADNTLHNADDPALNTIRQTILGNLSQLQNQHNIDTTATLLLLNQMIAEVNTLTTVPIPTPTKSTANPSNLPKNWQTRLDFAWQQIKSLLVIRHHQSEANALIGPQQFKLLKANVIWQLMQAQWAVMHPSNALYQQGLSNAKHWLLNAKQQNPTIISRLVGELTQLGHSNAGPDYPNLLTTLNQIDQTHLSSNNAPAAAAIPDHTAKTPKPVMPKSLPKSDLKKALPKTNKAIEV